MLDASRWASSAADCKPDMAFSCQFLGVSDWPFPLTISTPATASCFMTHPVSDASRPMPREFADDEHLKRWLRMECGHQFLEARPIGELRTRDFIVAVNVRFVQGPTLRLDEIPSAFDLLRDRLGRAGLALLFGGLSRVDGGIHLCSPSETARGLSSGRWLVTLWVRLLLRRLDDLRRWGSLRRCGRLRQFLKGVWRCDEPTPLGLPRPTELLRLDRVQTRSRPWRSPTRCGGSSFRVSWSSLRSW